MCRNLGSVTRTFLALLLSVCLAGAFNPLPASAQGVVVVHEPNGYFSPKFTVMKDCPPLGSARGVAFEDLNCDGNRNTGEPAITTTSWKLTGAAAGTCAAMPAACSTCSPAASARMPATPS